MPIHSLCPLYLRPWRKSACTPFSSCRTYDLHYTSVLTALSPFQILTWSHPCLQTVQFFLASCEFYFILKNCFLIINLFFWKEILFKKGCETKFYLSNNLPSYSLLKATQYFPEHDWVSFPSLFAHGLEATHAHSQTLTKIQLPLTLLNMN